jgi:hypothetical protein
MNAAIVRHSCCSIALQFRTIQHRWYRIAILARGAASPSARNGKPSDGTRQC